jgi:hypothetical protein
MLRWHSYSGVGEHVAVDDLVAVIETDKVAVEIRAKEAGGRPPQKKTPRAGPRLDECVC